jgi:Protein of unknown function (DUF1688)
LIAAVRPDTQAAQSLLTAAAVRERAQLILEAALAGRLEHFRVDLHRLERAADLTVAITRESYPSLEIPFHSRWRHFVVNGDDRWAKRAATAHWPTAAIRARAEFDLAIVSVLLDAGAGEVWRYRDPETDCDMGRSEGLAIASLAMFADGLFSTDPRDPLRVDAAKLAEITSAALINGFQVGTGNPLVGIDGRTDLLRRLGRVVVEARPVFARNDEPRPGGFFDHLANFASDGQISATTMLTEVLKHLGPIWPAGIVLDGIPLGDCWHHPAVKTVDATSQLVPFHKLSQWLTYSLIEPMECAGIAVADIDGLTGLAEYRNGGLLIDTGALALRDPDQIERSHEVASTLVVEWRALTVALLDRLADLVRQRLGRNIRQLPLPKVLQGGTWAAGRTIARRLRAGGSPPLRVISDGTVF